MAVFNESDYLYYGSLPSLRAYFGTEVVYDLIDKYAGLDLDYINEVYRIYDPVQEKLVEKPWADIVNNYSAPAGRTYWNEFGVLQTAGADEMIREYDPITGVFRGNRIWGSYTNSLPNSQSASGGWDILNSVVTTAGLDIFGGTEGVRITDNSVNGGHCIYRSAVLPAGSCTLFACVKAETIPWMELRAHGIGPNASVFINGATGAVGAYRGSLVSSVDVVAHPSIAGAWLVWIMYADTIGLSPGFQFELSNGEKTADLASYAGSGQSAVLLAGGMWPGMSKQPYIKTGGSAVTVAAESQIIDGANFSDMWNFDGSTIYMEAYGGRTGNNYLWQVDNGGNSDRRLFRLNGVDSVRAFSIAASTPSASPTFPTTDTGGYPGVKTAASMNDTLGQFVAAVGGASFSSGVDVPATPSRLRIGRSAASDSELNGYIQRILVFRRALPPSILQRLTAI